MFVPFLIDRVSTTSITTWRSGRVHPPTFAGVAQSVEQGFCKSQVAGSKPVTSSNRFYFGGELMDISLINRFLDEEIRVEWKTEDELENLADIIDEASGEKFDRTYIRGYTPEEYEYMGFDKDEDIYVLYCSETDEMYTMTDFLSALFEDEAEAEENAIDISSML